MRVPYRKVHDLIITSFSSSGTGKTTLLSHLAYLLAKEGLSVALIDIDNRSSIQACCGLEPALAENSTAKILDPDFQGDYPFVSLWADHCKRAEVIPAERKSLQLGANLLAAEPLGVMRLKSKLAKYPLPHDITILDAPGHEGTLAWSAILASTHLILSVEMSKKSIDDATFALARLYEYQDTLGVDIPKIVGFVPGRYDHDGSAIARSTLKQFPEIAQSLGCQLFSPIRSSPYFLNAYAAGLPVQVHAPTFEGGKDFLKEGNLFRRMSKKRLKGFEAEFKDLPAIVPYLLREFDVQKS